MGDVSVGERSAMRHGHEVVHLLPGEILTDARFNVRPWSGREEADIAAENQRIERLADSIERDGQIDDAVVMPRVNGDQEEKFVLYIGHRRRAAVALANEKRSANGGGLLRLRCKVDRTGGDYRRRAIVSNEARQNLTPMDRALLIRQLRDEHRWEGYTGAKSVAKYMGISVASVTQHERLIGANVSEELQRGLQEGAISVQSALELLGVKQVDQGRVLRRAAEIQHEEAVEREVRPGRSATRAAKAVERAAAPARGVQGARIQHPAVRKAVAEAKGASGRPRSKAEIIEWFESQDGPGNGYPDGPVRIWVRYLVDKWMAGAGTDTTLQAKWDAMVENADEGTKPKPAPVAKKSPVPKPKGKK